MYFAEFKYCLFGLTLMCSTILTVTSGEKVHQPTGLCYSCKSESDCKRKLSESQYGFACEDSDPFCNKGRTGSPDSYIESIYNAFKENATNFNEGCCYCKTCDQHCKKGCAAPAVDLCGHETRRECKCAQNPCSAHTDCKGRCTLKTNKVYCKGGKCSCVDKGYCEHTHECGNYCHGKGKYTVCNVFKRCLCTDDVRHCSTDQECKDRRATFTDHPQAKCTIISRACCLYDDAVYHRGIGSCGCIRVEECPKKQLIS